jgi:hypothetical protein
MRRRRCSRRTQGWRRGRPTSLSPCYWPFPRSGIFSARSVMPIILRTLLRMSLPARPPGLACSDLLAVVRSARTLLGPREDRVVSVFVFIIRDLRFIGTFCDLQLLGRGENRIRKARIGGCNRRAGQSIVRAKRNNCHFTRRTPRLGENRQMRTTYTRQNGAGLTYEIEADRHGTFEIMLNAKVIKRVTALSNYVGKPKWGSKKLEADAAEDAKKAIEAFRTDAG